jgi:hypothetical protein
MERLAVVAQGPEIAPDTRHVANAELDVCLVMEPGIWINRAAFNEGGAHGFKWRIAAILSRCVQHLDHGAVKAA